MAQDPYKILGVARTAPEEEIRRAYRRLAKEYHPDLNPNDAAASEERLKTINGAFAILGEADKRRQFDAGLIDGLGEPIRGGYAGAQQQQHRQRAGAGAGNTDEFGFSDIFSDLFGRARPGGPAGATPAGPARGQDVRYTLEVEFLEAANGTKKRVTLPDGGVLDLTVPEGVADGQVLRLKGKGGPSQRGGDAGDALVEIKVRAHADFKRDGDDIVAEVPITIDEAVLGAKIEVPTISGRVQLTVPKGTSSGRTFRLKGKGVKGATGNIGDQLVAVRIVLPETVDEKLAYFMAEWRQKHAYNPGR